MTLRHVISTLILLLVISISAAASCPYEYSGNYVEFTISIIPQSPSAHLTPAANTTLIFIPQGTPSGIQYLLSFFGLPQELPEIYENSTTTITDENGRASVILDKIIKYRMILSSPEGGIRSMFIIPSDYSYQIILQEAWLEHLNPPLKGEPTMVNVADVLCLISELRENPDAVLQKLKELGVWKE